jgi:hypothetical protein
MMRNNDCWVGSNLLACKIAISCSRRRSSSHIDRRGPIPLYIICDSLLCIRMDHVVLLMYASQAPVLLLQDFLVQPLELP